MKNSLFHKVEMIIGQFHMILFHRMQKQTVDQGQADLREKWNHVESRILSIRFDDIPEIDIT